MGKKHIRNCAVAVSIILLLCGCGYKFIGSPRTNIFIHPVTNHSLQPLIDIYLANALRSVFIKYPEYSLVSNVQDAEYTLKVHIREWKRSPLFFSGEMAREIVIARFLIETEIILHKNGRVVFTDTITDNIPVSLAKSYEEDDILSEVSKKLALKIYFHIVERK